MLISQGVSSRRNNARRHGSLGKQVVGHNSCRVQRPLKRRRGRLFRSACVHGGSEQEESDSEGPGNPFGSRVVQTGVETQF